GSHFNAKPPMDQSQRMEVPERVDHLHRLLAHLQDPATVLGVSQQTLPRALRIMHTVLTEAERRGYDTGWATNTTARAEIRVDGLRFQVTLREERDVRDVLPTPDELASKKVYAWQRFQPKQKAVPSGRLRLEVESSAPWDRARYWADRQRWRVEDKLGEVLAHVSARVQAERDRLRAEEEARQQRQRDWEVAMNRARTRLQEDRRIAELTAQLKNWKKAANIRAYCDQLEQAQATGADEADAEAAVHWREWCRSYADRIDPVKRGTVAPPEVEPDPSDLKPYLGRWSPYGP
ncbi:MAG TPA: hypothetical protein VEL76_36885, partial [Gemmataceae bacterium]|nr:hypothetical protein [Gemmataceae bacterium]